MLQVIVTVMATARATVALGVVGAMATALAMEVVTATAEATVGGLAVDTVKAIIVIVA